MLSVQRTADEAAVSVQQVVQPFGGGQNLTTVHKAEQVRAAAIL